MAYQSYDELIRRAKEKTEKSRLAVVSAADPHTVEAVLKAWKNGICDPILIGDTDKVARVLREEGEDPDQFRILHEPDDDAAAQKAVELVHSGEAQSIMKGLIQTGAFMRAIVKRENRLRLGSTICMMGIREIPNYHKLLAFADCGITICPTLEQKKEIIQSCVDTLIGFGYDTPKVACLSSVEAVNPKMQDSVDAAELKRMNQAGEITGCIVEGPISYDLAVSREAGEIKGYSSPVCGDADLMLFPDLTSANICTKTISHISGRPAAVLIVGTKVPVIACSRASAMETKYLCIAAAAARG